MRCILCSFSLRYIIVAYADDTTALIQPNTDGGSTGGGLFGFAGAVSTAIRPVCSDSTRRGLSVLGVRFSGNRPLLSPLDEPEVGIGARQTMRIAQIRVLNVHGEMLQLNPVSTMRCGRMLNRLLGIMFRSTEQRLPGEIRHLFRFSKLKQFSSVLNMFKFLEKLTIIEIIVK